VKARYEATREDIAARYVEWEVTGSNEEWRPVCGYFNPRGREGE
jgi:hypothetical protein